MFIAISLYRSVAEHVVKWERLVCESYSILFPISDAVVVFQLTRRVVASSELTLRVSSCFIKETNFASTASGYFQLTKGTK